ncbi:MAG TPA: cellulase family glycosylhydrolase [Geminicoccaceae bacterium]|nr:cellulase family glycosylhydrolase [Geminicoccus sp.]HMU51038.1 cellulase family glycosylhydrolase [Geminicoccaceae bacterium]
MINRRLFIAGTGVALAMPGIIRAHGAETRLQAKGNKIYYGSTQVRLRGVGMHSPLDRGPEGWGRPVSDYATVKKVWRANVVRISAFPGEWISNRTRMKKYLEQDVRAALKQGLFVIIDWHPVGWPNGQYEQGDYPGGDIELSSKMQPAREFWDYAAKKFGGDGRIAFELFNEPTAFGVGGTNSQKWAKLKPFLSQLLSIIRRSSQNLVLATGEGARILAPIVNSPLSDPNLAYAWHVYPNHGSQSNWTAELGNINQSKPIVVTEWGFDPDGNGYHYKGTASKFGTPLVNFMNQRGFHWTAWVWHALYGPRLLGSGGAVADQDDWCRPSKFGSFVLGQLGGSTPSC